MLVIDKKRMPVKESGLPQVVIDQVPRLHHAETEAGEWGRTVWETFRRHTA